ncbi:MAG: polysaccharide biosynthesis/export family protein [Pseudomonadota bacterium]
MVSRQRYLPILVLAAGFLTACETLPRSGPGDGKIETEAAAALVSESRDTKQSEFNYALLDLDRNVLAYASGDDFGSLHQSFGGGRGPAPEILVGVGDVIEVTIFESASGGLFIPAEASVRPGNFVQLPQQTVDKRGFITVPYAGQIRAAGRSLPQIQDEVVSRLANRAIEPQAIVSFVDRRATQASVIGEVNEPNRIAINEAGDRVLDIIARAGGLKFPGYESFVTLQRRGRTATVYFNTIVKNPAENIFVASGDTIYVFQERRSFQAFGASGLTGEFKFDEESITLAEAVGKSGGLLDDRADPGQVFLYRLEDRHALRKMGLDMSHFDPNAKRIPTIYRTNFRDPSGFFAARKFDMRNEDILYVSNADSVELLKFLEVLNTVTRTASGTTFDARATRNNAISLSDGLNVDVPEEMTR